MSRTRFIDQRVGETMGVFDAMVRRAREGHPPDVEAIETIRRKLGDVAAATRSRTMIWRAKKFEHERGFPLAEGVYVCGPRCATRAGVDVDHLADGDEIAAFAFLRCAGCSKVLKGGQT